MKQMIPAWVNGQLTPVEKLEVHQRGLRHKAVSVFVMDGDFVLLQRRALSKYHTPGLWANTCCTHPEWDEASDACAVRRLYEEMGIEEIEPRFCDRIQYRADVGNGLIEDEVVDVFLAEAGPDFQVDPNPNEVMDYEWIDIEDLAHDVSAEPNRFTPWLRIYMTEHREKIFSEMMAAE